ncbi:hypothetical protein FRB97_006465 [Tulasnella sp. 331]|nr:hypothetical protein FRB97_006465 [Tulasnella sp. 331]
MFSRNQSQSFSKRSSLILPSALIATGSDGHNKLAKSRPPILDIPGTFQASSSNPALSLSPVNMAASSTGGPAPDNLAVATAASTPTTDTAVSSPASSTLLSIPSLPSKRSFRSRFTFGSKSASLSKKDKAILNDSANTSTTNFLLITATGASEEVASGSSAQSHETYDRSLDPAVLRPASSISLSTADDMSLRQMQSQPTLRPGDASSRKRKSFDFAGLSRAGSTNAGPGPSRPTAFASVRGAFGARAFTPNGTAIREVVSEGEGEEDEEVDEEGRLMQRRDDGLEDEEETPGRPSFVSQRTITTPTNATFAHQRRRSRSIDSPLRRTSTDTANLTRVVDLSADMTAIQMQPTDSTQAEVGHHSPEKGGEEEGRGSGGGEKEWDLQDMRGAVQRMKSLVVAVDGGDPTALSPISPLSTSLLNTPRLPTGRSPLVQSQLPLVPPRPSPEAAAYPIIPEVTVQSPSTINTEQMESIGDTSFASLAPSIDVDINAIERVLEARGVGNTWIQDVFNDDDGDDGSRLFEEPSSRQVDTKVDPPVSEEAASPRVSLDLNSVDPNLAVLLSPNNLLSLTTTSSTPARPSPRHAPRSLDQDDTTLTLKWASNVNLRGKMASDREAAAAAAVPPSPLSPTGCFTPTAHNSGGLARNDSANHSRSRSRNNTPTPILTPILLSPLKGPSRLGPGSPLDPPPRRASGESTTSTTPSEPSNSRPTPSPFNPTRKLLPSVPMPISIPPIPGPLPPKQASPETPFFPPGRRRVGSSPSTPAARRRLTSATDDGEEEVPSSPERTTRRLVSGRIRGATIGEASGVGSGSSKRHMRRESSFETRPYARDEQTFERPATSAAYHKRMHRANSPHRDGDRATAGSPLAVGEQPPRAMTSFSSYNNTNFSPKGIRTSRGREREASPPRAMTSFGSYSNPQSNAAASSSSTRRHNIDRNGPPPIVGSGSGVGVRKRRSYSIDATAGMRYASAAAAVARNTVNPTHQMVQQQGGVTLDPMGPLTKKAFAAAGLMPSLSPPPPAQDGSVSRRGSGEAFLSSSKSYGLSGGGNWRDMAQPPAVRPGGFSRSTTLGDLTLPLGRRERENGSTAPNYPMLSLNSNERDHPSTPSSASGTGNSRTLYAGSTASSSTHHTGGSSPISNESDAIVALKERHELEKDALVSALAEAKRANKQLNKEKTDLEAYVGELEAKLEEALEMNQKMEGVRAAVMAMTGGVGFPASPSPIVEERKVKRRAPPADVSPMDAMPVARRRVGALGDGGTRSKRAATTIKSRRPHDISETEDNTITNYGSAHEVAQEVEVRRADFITIAGGPIPRAKKLTKRHSASEASVILPTMKASRETSMLIHELPPQHETHYAQSDAAEDDDMGEMEAEDGYEDEHDETLDQQDRTPGELRRGVVSPNEAPSFSFMDADEQSLASSEGSLKLRLSDELHLAELVSMGPGSADERSMMSGMDVSGSGQHYHDDAEYDSNECF